MWFTTLMPSFRQNIFELKLSKSILDEAEKRFLSQRCGFYQKMWLISFI